MKTRIRPLKNACEIGRFDGNNYPDPVKYRHLIDDPSLNDEKKDELILGVWVLMEGLVKRFYTGQIPAALLEEGLVSEQILKDFLEQGQRPHAPVRASKKRKPSRKNTKRTKRDLTI